jgi:hypothetical protein
MRVIAGLAIAALILSVVSFWATSRQLGALRGEHAALAEEVRGMQLAGRRAAAPEPEPKPSTPIPASTAEVSEIGSDPDVTRPTHSPSAPSTAGRSVPRFEPRTPAEDAHERAALLASLESPTGLATDETLERLGLFARMGREDAREALVDALDDPDPDVRKQALEALAELGDDDAVDVISPLIEDPEPKVRERLAKELGDTDNPAAGDVLVRLLRDESPDVVEESLKSLGDLRYQPALREVEAYSKSEDLKIAGAAGRALSAMGDEEGTQNTIEYLAGFLEAEDPDIRSTAVTQIGKIGGPGAVDLLEGALEDPDPDIRSKIHWYLAEME